MRFIDCGVVGSTQDVARDIANSGNFGPLWVRADAQTAGRGRRGRVWESPKGNLFCTGLYPHEMTPDNAGRISFVASLAVYDLIASYVDPECLALKWPNDVLINGAKTSGVLLENGKTGDQSWIMVGVGVNLVAHPPDTDYPATHILKHIRDDKLNCPEPLMTGPEAALAILASRFGYWFEAYKRGGFLPIREAWLSRASGIPGPVTVRLPHKTFTGEALTLGGDGELQVRLSGGTIRHVHAGDVFFSGI